MDKIELYEIFQKAQSICDPLDYAVRQRDLLYAISKYLTFDIERELLKKENE